jgi:hypothetical protein
MPSSSSDNSSQHLQYPPVQINHSLAQLDLDTLIMRSTSRRLPEEAGSALDESTFEFLGDSMLETSDDEAHTESIASTTPDDASDFESDEDDCSINPRRTHQDQPSLDADASEQQHDSRSVHSIGDSNLTEVPAYAGYHGNSHNVRLDEESGEESGVVLGSRVDRKFPDSNSFFFDVLKQYGCSQVRLVTKAGLSPQSIPTPDSYRILYIGPISAGEEEVVSSKICAALTACQNTSRSVMVQGRLQPYSPVMHAAHCADIRTLSKKGEPARIAMTLDNGKDLAFQSGREASSEPQPDLAIFCHPPVPRKVIDAQEYAAAREVFDRENIPYLDMTSAKQYGCGAPSSDGKSLSVCVEGRSDSEAEYALQEVLPMDYYTFSSLEPSQVNRHLALISPHMLASADKHPQISKLGSLWQTCSKKLQAPRSTSAMKILLMILLPALTTMLSAYIYGPIMVPMLSETLSNIEVTSVMTAPTSTITSQTATAHVLCHTGTNLASRDLTLVPVQPKVAKPEKKSSEKIVPFSIETTTDQQFTLIPHKDILNARKKPQLQIQVTREAQVIPIRFNRTISGVYIVDLEQQEPFGIFNVSIASYSKPLLQQSFEIGLGHNKSSSSLAQFLDTVMQKAVDAQRNSLNISATAVQGLLAGGGANVDAVAQFWKEQYHGAASGVQHAKDTLGRLLSAQGDHVKEVPEAAWVGLQQATAPLRTSSPMLRARTNALRVRCKVETAAGLSSKDKESWACSKVRGQG